MGYIEKYNNGHKYASTYVRIFNDCIEDNLCGGATVYCFWGEEPYTGGDKDNIVLEYRP